MLLSWQIDANSYIHTAEVSIGLTLTRRAPCPELGGGGIRTEPDCLQVLVLLADCLPASQHGYSFGQILNFLICLIHNVGFYSSFNQVTVWLVIICHLVRLNVYDWLIDYWLIIFHLAEQLNRFAGFGIGLVRLEIPLLNIHIIILKILVPLCFPISLPFLEST